MDGALHNHVVAFLAAMDGTEQVELTEPWRAVREAGGTPRMVAPAAGEIQMVNHLERGDRWPVDLPLDQARVDDVDALVLPGGVANPDRLRRDERAVSFVRQVMDSGRPVAVICHGPWTIVEADRVRGRMITSWPSLRTDLVNAGGQWVDREVVTDSNGPGVLVSSRGPGDLPVFCSTLVEQVARVPAHA